MTFKDIGIKINAVIDGIVEKSTMKEVADLSKDLVKTRTKRGFGVNESGDKATRLKGLSESYKKQRRRLKRQGKLAGDTTPQKSNLTKKGKMIADVESRASTAKAEVFIKDESSRKKAELQAQQGREFMNLSKSEIDKVKKLLEKKIKDDINKKGL